MCKRVPRCGSSVPGSVFERFQPLQQAEYFALEPLLSDLPSVPQLGEYQQGSDHIRCHCPGRKAAKTRLIPISGPSSTAQ